MSGVGVRVLHSDGPRNKSAYPAVKLVVESLLALTALVLLSPLLLLVAVLVRLGSHGPSLYGDKREGMGGQVFRCWKFRSMVADAHSLQQKLREASNVDGPQFKIENDPRVTRLGHILRKTNIDELRPSPFRENQTCIPWREGRLSVRPGITGLWQICRRDRSTGDFHQWIYYDLLYVRHMSPWMDVKILGATFITLGGKRSVPLTWIISPERLGTVTAHDDLRSQPARA
jgi:lipopolysaccharide/colanic/teichoic acid biosynthesis glycosyltransferase